MENIKMIIVRIRLICLISVSVIYLTACGVQNNNVIADNLNQDAANNVVLTLGENGIRSSYTLNKDGSYKISVSRGNQIKAIGILKQNGQPKKNFTSLGEEFKKDGFISSPLEEQNRFIYALDQEISAMLSELDGVVSVNTQISLPAPSDNLWQADKSQPGASVLIKYKSGYRIDLYTNRIKKLVSNAVPGLSQDRVEVLTVIAN
jgi:type III secretion protein J